MTGRLVSVAAVGLLIASVSTRALQSDSKPLSGAQAGPPADDAADERAAAVFVATCRDCHDAQTVTAHRRTRGEWEYVIEEMKENGATVTRDAARVVADYLTRRFGLVNINEAPSEEIATVLHLTARDSAAIVAFRTGKGPFADFEAVTKVPSIDLTTLRASKSFILYQE